MANLDARIDEVGAEVDLEIEASPSLATSSQNLQHQNLRRRLSSKRSISSGETLIRRGSIETESTTSPKSCKPEQVAEDDLSEISEDSPLDERRQVSTSSSDDEIQNALENQNPVPMEVGESVAMLQMKLEAMTWAAMAKDYIICSLEKKLKATVKIAKAEQLRNQELRGLLRNSKERQEATAQELQDAKEQVNKLAEAEERLCAQLGSLEAESASEDRRYRSHIASLSDRLKAQDQFIALSLKPLKSGRPVQVFVKDQSAKLQSDLSKAKENEQSLATKLDLAAKELSGLNGDLSDTKTDLRVSEVLRRNQARRLKVLEKERRYLMRKGATRSVRLAPRSHKKNETETPGGEGWKVFSVLEFEA